MPSDPQDLERWLLDRHARTRCQRLQTKTCCCVQHPEKVVLRLAEGHLVCGSRVRLERSLRLGGVESRSFTSVESRPWFTCRIPSSDTPQRQVAGKGARAGYRRGLVVEVAPGFVDATAVALASAPNVITHVMESNEPVFDPSDSDEEADPQGPILVDSHDEPIVNVGRFTLWLLSVAGTAIDSAQPTFSSNTC